MSKKEKKKGRMGGIIRNLVLIIAAAVFLFSAYQLVMIYLEYKKGTDEYDKIRQYAVESPVKEETKENDEAEGEEEGEEAQEVQEPQGPQIDFEALKVVNPDVVGWIEIETLDISYPIVQTTDNDHYLHYTFEGQRNANGAIFLEHTNSSDFEDCNTIIYGHNMRNGSMFGTFRKLHEQSNLTSPYVWICTPKHTWRYKIFSVHTASVTGETYTLFSMADEQFAEYLKSMKSASELQLDAEADKDDKVITMSTCTGNSSTRFVIQAKRLEKGEN